ncbi:hypothetical protein F53441_5094 [Fusarium austroafricanum]|uniref:Uncharacterized protein n=1 Tax=Fusarium austroafricanum TaxID=2364996 RepID=A0A8H4KIQ7_9HYPO|nr:hypothetical protein F53441_5094 [Fusarium austroafricanum]
MGAAKSSQRPSSSYGSSCGNVVYTGIWEERPSRRPATSCVATAWQQGQNGIYDSEPVMGIKDTARGRAFIATANSMGFTRSRINVDWADVRSSEMKTSGDECLTFVVYGDTYQWVTVERHEISGVLGKEAGKGYVLGRQGGGGEGFAVFNWTNVAMLAMLKLWQAKAASKRNNADNAAATSVAVSVAIM